MAIKETYDRLRLATTETYGKLRQPEMSARERKGTRAERREATQRRRERQEQARGHKYIRARLERAGYSYAALGGIASNPKRVRKKREERQRQ